MKIKQWRIGKFTFGFITGRGEAPKFFDGTQNRPVEVDLSHDEKCDALNPETGRYCIMGKHTSDHMDDMFRIWRDNDG